MNISGSHAVAASTIVFMNLTTEDVARYASIVFGAIYVAMAIRSHFIQHPWGKKNATKEEE